jgi:transcriptional regulator with PAS, ATPase and Fis domain
MVREKRFREDLFYRIRVVPIVLPPLRRRRDDIPLLTHRFLNRLILRSDTSLRGMTREAMETLIRYDWPRNVRELKSTLEFAAINCNGAQIGPGHLPSHLHGTETPSTGAGDLPLNIDQLIRRQLGRALALAGGNQSMAARLLGVSRVTVWKWIKKYEIDLRRIGEESRAG